jgi:predicted DNA-binding transcriptional regulator AlpA
MKSPRVIEGERPPSYLSKVSLAAELDISESTVDNWVERGLLPKPIRIGGSLRWCWAEVVAHLAAASQPDADPFLTGLNNVA